MKPVLPIALRLQNRPVLVVGGGPVAAAKVERLLACGARLTVVAPELCETLQGRARSGELAWNHRLFQPTDVDGQVLVLAATGRNGADPQVFAACEARQIICTSADVPELSSAFWMADQRAGSVVVAVSTQGTAPGLAGRLARQALQGLPPDVGELVGRYGALRNWLIKQDVPKEDGWKRRGKVLRQLASQPWSYLRGQLQQQRAGLLGALEASDIDEPEPGQSAAAPQPPQADKQGD